jgi:hypothetical protein
MRMIIAAHAEQLNQMYGNQGYYFQQRPAGIVVYNKSAQAPTQGPFTQMQWRPTSNFDTPGYAQRSTLGYFPGVYENHTLPIMNQLLYPQKYGQQPAQQTSPQTYPQIHQNQAQGQVQNPARRPQPPRRTPNPTPALNGVRQRSSLAASSTISRGGPHLYFWSH